MAVSRTPSIVTDPGFLEEEMSEERMIRKNESDEKNI
jgi:hypothetical protein